MLEDTESKPGLRMLVADDNPVVLALLESMLDMLEYPEVQLVTNGREAVEACREQMFDLILMDCQMPEMDGFEATRCIRAIEATNTRTDDRQSARIIAITGDSRHDNLELCREAGMNHFLSKPFTITTLKSVLDSCSTRVK
jgi:CheY-like chemotaxis protein